MSVSKTVMAAIGLCGLLASLPAMAQGGGASQLEAIKQQMREMRQAHERQMKTLEGRLKALEARKSAAPPPAPAKPARAADGMFGGASGSQFQIGLSTSVAAGGSSAADGLIEGLQAGHHDPNRNGFTLQNAELFLGGSVDPYFDAQANVTLVIDREGETVVELEEAFATTRSLPAGLQIKAGQFYTEFGRANPMHPHRWDFVDQPVILSRLFGPDGLRSQGAQVSWLTPLPWFSEIAVSAANSRGETLRSFLGNDELVIRGTEFMDRPIDDIGDLLYSARWLNGVDLSDEVSVNIGVSGATGPNATGAGTRTYIVGGDIYVKWQPKRTRRGFPFVAFHGEALYRKFEFMDPGTPEHEDFTDWGIFGQATYGFAPGWVAGLRVDYATGDGDDPTDIARIRADSDDRWRLSPNLTWYPTEFSKVRLQYNRDWADHLDADENGVANTVWLQLEFSLGGHFAHTF